MVAVLCLYIFHFFLIYDIMCDSFIQCWKMISNAFLFWDLGWGGAQSVERVTPGEDVQGLIPTVAARFLLVGSVSV